MPHTPIVLAHTRPARTPSGRCLSSYPKICTDTLHTRSYARTSAPHAHPHARALSHGLPQLLPQNMHAHTLHTRSYAHTSAPHAHPHARALSHEAPLTLLRPRGCHLSLSFYAKFRGRNTNKRAPYCLGRGPTDAAMVTAPPYQAISWPRTTAGRIITQQSTPHRTPVPLGWLGAPTRFASLGGSMGVSMAWFNTCSRC